MLRRPFHPFLTPLMIALAAVAAVAVALAPHA